MVETLGIVYWDAPDSDPSDFTEVMQFADAIEKARELSRAGFHCTVYKLTETHHFKAGK